MRLGVVLFLTILVYPASSEVLMTLKEGLKATFPDAKRVIRTEIYLKEENKGK